MAHCLIYVTASNAEEAKEIGRALVEERLVACANVLPTMIPIFWWEGRVQEDSEAILLAKTRKDLVQRVIAFVEDQHSYDTPAILALPIEAGYQPFLDWIDEETQGADHPDRETE
jgi:periplasmic divalent cation tolerance protein